MRRDCPGLDKLWLAELLPDAAPGNLAARALGSWPSRLPGTAGAAGSASTFQQGAAGLAPAATTAAAAADRPGALGSGGTAAAVASAAAFKQPGVSSQPDADVVDLTLDDDEWVGEWLSEGEEATGTGSEEADEQLQEQQEHGIDIDGFEIVSDGEEDGQQQQREEDQPSPRQQLHSSAWPWRVPATQQQQRAVQKRVDKQPGGQQGMPVVQGKGRSQQQPQPELSLHDMLAHGSRRGFGAAGAEGTGSGDGDDEFRALLEDLAEKSETAKQLLAGEDRQKPVPCCTPLLCGSYHFVSVCSVCCWAGR